MFNITAKIMSSYMDINADPCHDFYQYACGNWATRNPIPEDLTAYDTFEILRENLDAVLKELLEGQPRKKYHALSSEVWKNDAITKAKHFYQSCMNYGETQQ
jgi:predicted metalloendopeptidase